MFVLGIFFVGVVLVESEFCYELEVDIEFFKGLLFGLFFVMVGVFINFMLLLDNSLFIVMLVVVLIVIKVLIFFVLGILFLINKW